MKREDAIKLLDRHPDPQVQEASAVLTAYMDRRSRIINTVNEGLQQLRLDMKYLMFDLEATRRERDEALKGKS
jgi:hypothetical protein